MPKPIELDRLAGVVSRLASFAVERHPYALSPVIDAYEAVAAGRALKSESEIEAIRPEFRRELTRWLHLIVLPPGIGETTPRHSAAVRMEQAHRDVVADCDGLLRRIAIELSLSAEER